MNNGTEMVVEATSRGFESSMGLPNKFGDSGKTDNRTDHIQVLHGSSLERGSQRFYSMRREYYWT